MNFLEKKKLFGKLLGKKENTRFYSIVILLIIQSILEVAGVGMVIPLLSVIFYPEGNLFLGYVKYLLGYNSINQNFLIIVLMFLMFIFFVFKSLFLYFCQKELYNFAYDVQARLKNKIFNQYITMSYAEYLHSKSSILITNISTNIPLITQYFTIPFLQLVSEGLILVSVLLFLLFYEPGGFAILSFVLILVIVSCYKFVSKSLKNMGRDKENLENQLVKTIQSSIGSMKVTKLYNLQKSYLKEFKEKTISTSIIQAKVGTFSQIPRLALELSGFLVVTILIFYLILANKSNIEIISVIGIFAAAGFKVIPCVNRILFSLQALKYAESVLTTVNNILLSYDKKINPNENLYFDVGKKIIFNKTIKFKDISFKYQGTENIILDKLNFDLHKNKKIGIIGRSGAGKTTFLDILVGLIEPNTGAILADGKQISLNNNSWRNSIAYVPQYNYLIDGTLEKNIAFGVAEEKIDATRIDELLELTFLKKELVDQTGRYHPIGERGMNLSGGQVQRIAIARALYKKPKILIMDEPTSSLDRENEKIIIEIINRIENLTLIIVSHKKTTLEKCDEIFTLKNGTLNKNI